ncbi:borealin-2 [Scophthalmus maximus]|uniref:borealin-2 n=1 Tax=Scophthalmus maximus TaxID=52904 RepID=UPI001FA8E337|nr:borealin-2 [Scophthalmus maximus]
MSLRRKRNASNAQSKEQQGRDMCQRRLALFVRQFEKEAEERMNELDARMENMLATVDKVYNVEVMKMPLSLRNTLLADLMSEEQVSASDVSIAMKNESLEMNQPLKRNHSKRVKSTDSPPVQSAAVPRASVKLGNKTKRTRTLAGSNSTGNLRGSTVTAKRTQSRLTKSNEQTAPVKPKLRSVVSTGDLHCSVAGSAAHITVTTAQGQTVSFSEETKDEINLDMLDDLAWCQIQRLTRLMDYLSRRNPCQQ